MKVTYLMFLNFVSHVLRFVYHQSSGRNQARIREALRGGEEGEPSRPRWPRRLTVKMKTKSLPGRKGSRIGLLEFFSYVSRFVQPFFFIINKLFHMSRFGQHIFLFLFIFLLLFFSFLSEPSRPPYTSTLDVVTSVYHYKVYQ